MLGDLNKLALEEYSANGLIATVTATGARTFERHRGSVFLAQRWGADLCLNIGGRLAVKDQTA